MKIGDKVQVVKTSQTDLGQVSVGDKGIIVDIGCDIVYVLLDKFENADLAGNTFLYHDRSCQFSKERVRVA